MLGRFRRCHKVRINQISGINKNNFSQLIHFSVLYEQNKKLTRYAALFAEETNNKMTNNEKCWYAVYTHANAEQKLLQRLTEGLLDGYLPSQRVIKQWSDRSKTVIVPVFKSYLFVFVDVVGLHRVKMLAGFSHYISFGGYPTVIPQQQIDLMKAVIEQSQGVTIKATKLVSGDKVNIFKGALAGYDGVLTQDQGNKKVALAITKLGQSMLVSVPLDHIVKCDNPIAHSVY
jgi:transcription antitermination factor NusG